LNGYWVQPEAFWRNLPGSLEEPLFDDIWFKRNEIPDYKTEDYGVAYETWFQWHDHNLLPNTGGWADQPAIVGEIINVFERTIGKYREINHGSS